MKTLYERIVEKVEALDKFTNSKTKEAKIARFKFIHFCLENKITYEMIATILGITKGRVYQIAHYFDKKNYSNKQTKNLKQKRSNSYELLGSYAKQRSNLLKKKKK